VFCFCCGGVGGVVCGCGGGLGGFGVVGVGVVGCVVGVVVGWVVGFVWLVCGVLCLGCVVGFRVLLVVGWWVGVVGLGVGLWRILGYRRFLGIIFFFCVCRG
ncbi:hypothetical protein RA281_27750, partial [Pseudomonas syringae pv. tagetis]